jgi:hypothetical protein
MFLDLISSSSSLAHLILFHISLQRMTGIHKPRFYNQSAFTSREPRLHRPIVVTNTSSRFLFHFEASSLQSEDLRYFEVFAVSLFFRFHIHESIDWLPYDELHQCRQLESTRSTTPQREASSSRHRRTTTTCASPSTLPSSDLRHHRTCLFINAFAEEVARNTRARARPQLQSIAN